MPAERESRIIVLHLTKYGDRSQVVQALDRDKGRSGFFLRGAGKGRGAQGQYHSLSILDVTVTGGKGDLEYLKEAERPHPLDNIRSDPYKSAVALFISELLYRGVQDGAMDSGLFDFITDRIIALETATGSVANFHLKFLVDFCGAMGFRPKDNYSTDTPLFLPYSAEFTAPDALAETFSAEESLLLHTLLNSDLQQALAIPLSRDRRGAFAQKMADFLAYHLSLNLNIRSLKVLHDLFS